MSTYEHILNRRTIRKFSNQKIDREILTKMINAARLAPSASNMQPLKYVVITDSEKVNNIFEQVKWAAYIAPDGNPAENERPTAFIAILVDTTIKSAGYELDIGAAAQSIFLVCEEEGIGTCWMGAINREEISKMINCDASFILNTVIALGYKAEQPIFEDEQGSIKYYKDEKGTLHVPKRKLDDIVRFI